MPVACVSDDGLMCIVNRGDLLFTLWDIRNPDEVRVIQVIDLLKQIKANGNPGFIAYQNDTVTDVRLIAD